MKITCKAADIVKALDSVSGACAASSNMKVLENVMLDVKKDGITVSATNLEIFMKAKFAAAADEEMCILVNARKLTDVVKSFGKASEIEAVTTEKHIKIKGDGAEFKLPISPRDEFPKYPEEVSQFKTFKAAEGRINVLLKRTVFAVGKDQTRAVLCGVYMSIQNGEFVLAATDGRCLAFNKQKIGGELDIKGIIPAKAVGEVLKITDEGKKEVMSVGFSQNYALFESGNVTLLARLIEGQFPKVENVIPAETKFTAKLKKKDLSEAVDKVGLMSDKTNKITLAFNEDKVLIKSLNEKAEYASEVNVAAEYKNLDASINVNGEMFGQSLRSNSLNEITIGMNGPKDAVMLKYMEEPSYTYVIMPMS